jgi:2-polyprenyl-3-methyl-5-hydroxy-6-metoxy-1,4-benzoquinol methylase
VKQAFLKRNNKIEIKDDFELLRELHRIFPIPKRGRYSCEDYTIHVKPASRFLDCIERYTPLHGKDLLDVGTGHGGLLVLRENYGLSTTTGVDSLSNKNGFEKLCHTMNIKKSKAIQYLTGDFLDIDFGDSKFDLITSLNCFEHYSNPDAILEKCITLLHRGGYMFISFGPLFRSPYGAHRFRYTGIPYLQNLFSDELVYRFFSEELGVVDEFQEHKNVGDVEISGDPYCEMNRFRACEFEGIFKERGQTKIIKYLPTKDFEFSWFRKLAAKYMENCSEEDLVVDGIEAILRKE